MASARGRHRMPDRRYETLVLLHPDLGEPAAKELAERVKKLIEDQGGTVGQMQEWGLRELAYVLAKQRRAFYVLFQYRSTPKALLEIERNLKLMDPVLPFVSARPAENTPPTPPRPLPARRPQREEPEVQRAAA